MKIPLFTEAKESNLGDILGELQGHNESWKGIVKDLKRVIRYNQEAHYIRRIGVLSHWSYNLMEALDRVLSPSISKSTTEVSYLLH